MNIVKKYWFLVILAIMAVLSLFFWFLGRNKKININENLPNLPKVTYPTLSGQAINSAAVFKSFPEVTVSSMPVYQINPVRFSLEQSFKTAQVFGFPEKPTNVSTDIVFGRTMLWISSSQNLGLRLSPIDVSISTEIDFDPLPTQGELMNQEELLSYTKNLLNTASLGQGLMLSFPVYETVLDDNVSKISLSPIVDSIEVVDLNPLSKLVGLQARRDSKLFSLTFRAGFSNPVKTFLYPLKNRGELLDSIYKEGRILLIGDPAETPITTQINEIEISSIEGLLLYVPENPTLLYPVFRLKGLVNTTASGQEKVIIVVPAVKSFYLSNN